MNKVLLVGRLTKDPELRNIASGRAVCQISVAINRTFTNAQGQREADFIPVVVWDKQAENLAKYMRKGSLVGVEGRIQTRNYDGTDGKKVYVTEVVGLNIQFLESKGATGNNTAMPEPPATNDYNQNETITMEKDPFESFGASIEIDDNDLPF